MDGDRRAQWLRGVLDLCLLAILCRGESYGYQLSQALTQLGFGAVQGGTLYPVLLRLERSGLVTTDWRHSGTGPARKYYRISAAGRQTVGAIARDWHEFAGAIGATLREVS